MYLEDIDPLIVDDCFIKISEWVSTSTISLKMEGLSVTGSIKIKPALLMIEQFENTKILSPGKKIIESSSGNLGLALSMICSWKGYSFTCVSDPNISPLTEKTIRAYGTNLIIVKDKDANGGFLGTRIDLIRSMLEKDKDLIWVNQYENLNNVEAHYNLTGKSILKHIPSPDYVFIGAGTTGTLGGVSSYIKQHSPNTTIIAVDSIGSVTFGGKPGKRRIPGLGTSSPPAIRKHSFYNELIYVSEKETILACRELAKNGILAGGSTGTVMAAIRKYSDKLGFNKSIVAISPDMGEKYVDTIYNDEWFNLYYN